MPDLPPDVRDRAAQAVEAELRRADKWLSRGVSLRVVDAVTSVVAEEIARPLQARIEELEAANAAVEEENDLLRDVIQQKHARVEVLTAALTEIVDLRAWQLDRAGRVVAVAEAVDRARAALAAGEEKSDG